MSFTLINIYSFGSTSIKQRGLSDLNLYAARIDAEFRSLASVAQDTADFLSIAEDLSEEALYKLLTRNVQQSPLIYGSAIAFEPYAFNQDQLLFSPYVYRSAQNDELVAIEIGNDSYNYNDGTWEWFSAPKEFNQAFWTEPFFDEGAGNVLMVTYTAPFFLNSTFRGVATIDVSLEDLQQQALIDLDNQFFAILGKSGQFISHYNSDLIMNSSIQEQAALINNEDYQNIVNQILAGESGIGIVNNFFLNGSIVDGDSWLFYSPIPSTGWSLSTMAPESLMTEELLSFINLGVLGLISMILITLAVVIIISYRITKPIHILAQAVDKVAKGKLDTAIDNIRSIDELGQLSIGFNLMLKNLKKQILIQSQQSADRKIVEKELQMARETQKKLLPSEFPPFPHHDEFELHAINQAANHVAGDFFDFFMISPKTLIFVIADVSGKGMSAALVMAVTKTIIHNLAKSGKTPAQILQETNERLIDNHKGSAFVTVFLGSYNINNGKLMYANGGHSSALRISKNGQISSFGAATGTIVGMLEHQEYSNAETRLQPGETMLLYTDGMSEARAPSGEFFGEGRIISLLEQHASASPTILCETAVKIICQYQNNNLADDLTLLALKRTPTKMSKLISDFMRPIN